MEKSNKKVGHWCVTSAPLLLGVVAMLVLGGSSGCVFRGRTTALNNAADMLRLSEGYGKETTTIIEADQQVQERLAKLVKDREQEAAFSGVWSLYREGADAYADGAIYRLSSPKSRVGELETLLIKAARTAVTEARKVEQLDRNRQAELLIGLAKIELQKRDLSLAQKKIKLLATRDDLLRQIAFYLNFAATTEAKVQDGTSSP